VDLPEGTPLEIEVVEPEDELDADELARLDEQLERSRLDERAGRLQPLYPSRVACYGGLVEDRESVLDCVSMKARLQPGSGRRARRRKPSALPEGGRWRMSDLPPELQAELQKRLEEAKRGKGLIPFNRALEEAERMADEIVEILNRRDAPRE
jgi:hypothetical protein